MSSSNLPVSLIGAAIALIAVLVWANWFRGRLRRDARIAADLRDSEERWKFALDGAGDGVWDADLKSGKTLYSRRWKEILGYAEHEIGDDGDEWLRLIHPDDVTRVRAENQACLDRRADNFICEFRMRTKDGRWLWILDRGKVVLRSNTGEALRMIGTHTDISARKAGEAREAARANALMQIATHQPLPAILDSIVRDAESRCDWICSILLVDARGTALTRGAAPHVPDFIQGVTEGLPIAAGEGACGAAAHARARVVCAELRTHPNWARYRAVAEQAGWRAGWSEPILDANGRVLGTFANYRSRPGAPTAVEIDNVVQAAQIAAIAIERSRDEQALRASEAQLAAKSRALEVTLERMEEGVMMVSPERIVEVCNRRAIELLELPPEMMAARPTFAELLEYQWRTEEFAHTSEDLQRFVRAGGILDQAQRYERQRPNGRWLEVRSVPIAGGGVLRTYADITEHKRAETTRRALEAQLLEARKLEAIGTLAGGIAHDFNNVMAAILGNVAFARQDIGEGHPAQLYLDQINKAGRRARSLVQQILAFSRKMPDEFVGVSLRPMVGEAVTMLRSVVGSGVTLNAVLPEGRLAVRTNPTQLQQVLMNLGTNAWQALPDGVGKIELGLDETVIRPGIPDGPAGLEPGVYAHLWVRDNGRGMNAETRQRIFDPFFTTKPIGQGTGLGLAVVHGIVEAHGGAIEVTSAPGHGSSFDLYLPLVDAESEPMPLDIAVTDTVRGHGEHVLYIDDDEVMALMVDGLLQRLGYRSTCLLDADAAIALVARAPSEVDIVVTDFNMPNRSGLDVVRALAALRPALPVVISSGYVSDELRASATQLGVRAVMQKEHTLEELGPLLHAVLAGR